MSNDDGARELAAAGYRDVPPDAGGSAARGWWDENASEYLDEHGEFLGAADFCWCPEGLREKDAQLLGEPRAVAASRVLEIGAGAAQCSRWIRTLGGIDGAVPRDVQVVATDVSGGMLAGAAELDRRLAVRTPLVQADARALPFAADSFDIVFTSFGALPFLPDAERVHREVARVLR